MTKRIALVPYKRMHLDVRISWAQCRAKEEIHRGCSSASLRIVWAHAGGRAVSIEVRYGNRVGPYVFHQRTS